MRPWLFLKPGRSWTRSALSTVSTPSGRQWAAESAAATSITAPSPVRWARM